MSQSKSPVQITSSRRRASKQVAATPSHLYLKGEIYYFRFCLNTDLRKRLGHSELRLNLGTGGIRLAKTLAGLLYFYMQKLLREESDLDYRKIKERMNTLLQRMLEAEQNDVSPPPSYDRLSQAAGSEFNPEIIADGYALISKNIASGGSQILAKHGAAVVAQLVQAGYFAQEEITEDNIMQIVKAYFQMVTTYQSLLAKRARGDFISEDQVLFRDYGALPGEERISSTGSPMDSSLSSSPSYSKVCNSFIESKKRTRSGKRPLGQTINIGCNVFRS